MPPPPRRPWLNRLIVFLIFALPIGLFFATQAISNYTRSGSVDQVWFIQTREGPRMLSRDRIAVGTEKSAKVINRLSLVDARNGDRLTRERLEVAFDYAGLFDPGADQKGGLWFRRKADGGDPHLRDLDSLDRMRTPAGATPPEKAAPTFPPFASEVVLPSGAHWTTAQNTANWVEPQVLVDSTSGNPIVLANPVSFLVLHKGDQPGLLLVSRVGEDLEPVWTARLERQRAVMSAAVLEDALIVVSSGVARDFAIALGLADGKTRWVHHF